MKAHERVAAAIRAANEAGRTGLVPFVTAGYPEPKDFISTLKGLATWSRSAFRSPIRWPTA
jgi:tryptophan synthase alpha subunit